LNTEDFVFGIGIYSPFGIGGWSWDNHGSTRYLTTESLTGTVSANPTVAMQVNAWLQIGLGADLLYSMTSAERSVDQAMAQAPDGRVEMNSDGVGLGFNLGLLFRLPADLRLGVIYRSPIRVEESGDLEIRDIAAPLQPLLGGARFKTPFDSTITFPEILGIGIGLPLADRWVVTLESEWVRWSRMDRRVLNLRDEIPAADITDMVIDLNWVDIWMLKAGAGFQATDNLSLRCGYAYFQSPVPDATLTPDYPDADKHYASLGFGWHWNRFYLDGYYAATFYKDRDIRNPILSGRYENFNHLFGFSVGYDF
jgi:long-chain fatty acid transport protein